jgi:hypothetical protein
MMASVSSHDDKPQRQRESFTAEGALGEIDDALNGLTSSAHTRELRAMAEAYRQQIAQWGARPPNDVQREALGELLTELLAKVHEAASKRG